VPICWHVCSRLRPLIRNEQGTGPDHHPLQEELQRRQVGVCVCVYACVFVGVLFFAIESLIAPSFSLQPLSPSSLSVSLSVSLSLSLSHLSLISLSLRCTRNGKPMLEFLAIKRKADLKWAIPGMFVRPGLTMPAVQKAYGFPDEPTGDQVSVCMCGCVREIERAMEWAIPGKFVRPGLTMPAVQRHMASRTSRPVTR
jgi:hypothetical protein